MRKDLALFDFDGTITRKDTFLEFIKFHRGQTAFYLGFTLLSPVMLLFKLGILANWQAKEAAIRYFFSGENVEKLDKSGREFCDKVMPKIVRKAALTAIHEHQGKGHEVVVVSASAENWVLPYCQQLGIKLIATKLEIKDGKVSGSIDGKNCYGPEKVHRIKKEIDLENYQEINVYGDSKGDREMLALGTNQFYKPFRNT